LARKGLRLVLIIITIMILLPGCSGQSDSAQKPAQQESQRAETPPEFKKIISETEKIISLTAQKWRNRQPSMLSQSMPVQQKEGNQTGQSGKQQQSGKQSSEDGQEQGEQYKKQGQQETGGKGNDMQGTWEQETKSLMSIHENWTTLQVKAMQAGMNNTTKSLFDEALDRLTAEINAQNDEESLLAAIDLYGQFTEIARLFQAELPPSFYDTKYQVMLVAALGQMGEWETAHTQTISMQEEWDNLKTQADRAEKSNVNCTEIAIRDLARAVNNNSRELVIIKGEIAVKEMTKLQEELSSKKMTRQQS
jgi:hypothetical protein